MNYSPELKDALLRRMLPPNNESITKISREEGISEQTLRNWRDKARKEGYAAPGTDAVPDDWSTQDKFLVVVETASMNETELAEYARKNQEKGENTVNGLEQLSQRDRSARNEVFQGRVRRHEESRARSGLGAGGCPHG